MKTITFHVSGENVREYQAQLVRLRHGYDGPGSPGFLEQERASAVDGQLRRQLLSLPRSGRTSRWTILIGSCDPMPSSVSVSCSTPRHRSSPARVCSDRGQRPRRRSPGTPCRSRRATLCSGSATARRNQPAAPARQGDPVAHMVRGLRRLERGRRVGFRQAGAVRRPHRSARRRRRRRPRATSFAPRLLQRPVPAEATPFRIGALSELGGGTRAVWAHFNGKLERPWAARDPAHEDHVRGLGLRRLRSA